MISTQLSPNPNYHKITDFISVFKNPHDACLQTKSLEGPSYFQTPYPMQ